MTALNFTILITLCGILAVTLIDAIGSISSRRLKFNYGWLSILSLMVYTLAPFLLAKKVSFEIALFSNLIIAFYDATVGYSISRKLKAYTGAVGWEEKISISMLLLIMGFTALISGYVGYAIGS